jgi:DNA-binding NarL/FixJ family response regulator
VTERLVLIIEDDPLWQSLLQELVADIGFTPLVAPNRQAALQALGSHTYVLAIVDISLSMPDHTNRDGVEALRRMAGLPARLPAIVVTGYPTVDLAIETLAELNAVHFFCKSDFDRRKFAKIVQREASRGGVLPPAEVEPGVLKTLTDREREVLALLIQGLTNRQMAGTLNVTVNTVKKHMQSIFTKFNVETRAAAVARALGREE